MTKSGLVPAQAVFKYSFLFMAWDETSNRAGEKLPRPAQPQLSHAHMMYLPPARSRHEQCEQDSRLTHLSLFHPPIYGAKDVCGVEF